MLHFFLVYILSECYYFQIFPQLICAPLLYFQTPGRVMKTLLLPCALTAVGVVTYTVSLID